MTAVRDQVAVAEKDNMADLVLSQDGTTIANFVRYQFQVGNLCRFVTARVVHAMTNLVLQTVRKLVRQRQPHHSNPPTVAGFFWAQRRRRSS